MSEKTISTEAELKAYLKKNLSEKRYNHTLGVAQTAQLVLEHYSCKSADETFLGMKCGIFCGLIHDIAREFSNDRLCSYCEQHGYEPEPDQKVFPVLLHGYVSAQEAVSLMGDYPVSWYKAVCLHTVGSDNMDEVALALFIADFIEPSRSFMTDEKREFYLKQSTIEGCAFAVLSDMMKHWNTKPGFKNAAASLRMADDLKKRTGM